MPNTLEVLSVDDVDRTGARLTVKVTIDGEEFVQELCGIPVDVKAARKALRAYADEYEAGLDRTDPDEPPPPDPSPAVTPLDSLIGKAV